MRLGCGTGGYGPPSTEEGAHGLSVGQVNREADTGHDHHPGTNHLDVPGRTAQEVDHHLTTHAHQHGNGDHEYEQTNHESSDTKADGGRAEGAEEDDEWQDRCGRAVDGGSGVTDAVEVHVASWREGLVGFGRAVFVDEVLHEAHHVRGNTQEHHRAEHDQQKGDEDGDVVNDARFGKRFAHDERNDTNDAEEGPHAKARKHTDVE